MSTLLLDRFGPSCSKHSSARARIKVMWREQQLEGLLKKKKRIERREKERERERGTSRSIDSAQGREFRRLAECGSLRTKEKRKRKREHYST